jgi:hypothetical protein
MATRPDDAAGIPDRALELVDPDAPVEAGIVEDVVAAGVDPLRPDVAADDDVVEEGRLPIPNSAGV